MKNRDLIALWNAVGWAGVTTIILDLTLPFFGVKSLTGYRIIDAYPYLICWGVVTAVYYGIYAIRKRKRSA